MASAPNTLSPSPRSIASFCSWLEHAQDVIVVGLAVVLFGVMIRSLVGLARHGLSPAIDFRRR